MIHNGNEAKQKLLNGVNIIDSAVSTTLGPKGRNVAIQKNKGVHVTKDGVTVASVVDSKDAVEQMAINMMREAAANTVKGAGDGTTTVTVIAAELIRQGMKFINAGDSPVDVVKVLRKAKDHALELLREHITEIKEEQVRDVATISANNDEEIGLIIADAVKAVGKHGVITVSDSNSIKTFVEVTKGMEFNQGYLSSSFVTNKATLQCELENPLIVLYARKFIHTSEVTPLLTIAAKTKRPILFICDGMEHDPLSTVVMNSQRNIVKACVVQAPAYGEIRKERMKDIAVATNAIYIDPNEGNTLKDITLETMGSADSVSVGPNSTTIIKGHGDPAQIESRIYDIKKLIELEESPYEEKKLRERLGKLDGGAAVIRVGASSEMELKEKKDRIDDALGAAKAAIAEGVIPGAGFTSLAISKALEDADELLLSKALKRVCFKILENAGIDPNRIIYQEFQEGKVFDSLYEEWVDPWDSGIIDPAKVLRLAIQNAVSVASMILTTECVIYNEEEPELQPAWQV